jgi:ribosomal protein S6
LFILNTSGREDGLKETLDQITAEITAAGGKVETVQKMDKRNFARVANRKHSSGFYANVIFECEPATMAQLRHRFALNDQVFRVMFTAAPPAKPPAK